MCKNYTHENNSKGIVSTFNLRYWYILAIFSLFNLSCREQESEISIYPNLESDEDLSEYLVRIAPEINTNTDFIQPADLNELAAKMIQTDLRPDEMNRVLIDYFRLNDRDWRLLLSKLRENSDLESQIDLKALTQLSIAKYNEPFHLANLKGKFHESDFETLKIESKSDLRVAACDELLAWDNFGVAYTLIPRFASSVGTRAIVGESGCKYMLSGFSKKIGKVMPLSPAAVAMVAAHSGGKLRGDKGNKRVFVNIGLASAFGLAPATLLAWLPGKKK